MPPTPTPTPIPRGAESAPSRPYLTRDPPDIENLASDKLFLDFVFIRISQMATHSHFQLALNPRTKEFANAVPSMATKKNKKHWKRNDDKEKNLNNCG